MWQYTLVMFLYITTTYCKASKVSETDTVINTASGKLLGINGNLTPQQIIYVYGPQQWKTQNGVNLIEKAENDFLITPGIGAHKFHNRKLPWYKARKICIQEGGHLAIINSNSEEKILLRLLDENKETQGWLGIHDIYDEGDWSTIMDEPLETAGYSKWIPNQPDNYNGEQHCGILVKDGGIDDLECSTANVFFCEINF
nr:PREDICTED: hemolymph lipopolysaccharide-binding protein-like [Linepithema humile]